jgi:hypothetical protein
MRRFMRLSFALWFASSMTLAQACLSAAQTRSTYSGYDTSNSTAESDASSDRHFDTSGYSPQQNESQALTQYLKQRRLPLVGAQVLQRADGRRMVVLYGFVGSDFGKSDAVEKARRFLHDTNVDVDNRINVRPELLASNRPSSSTANNADTGSPPAAGSTSNSEGSSSPDDSSSYPGPESYKAQQANPYMQQLSSMMPLIALLGVLGMSMAGGSSGFSLGSSPFSRPMYRSPYASPYGPYGSPYSGSPFGSSPYGGSPFATSPYGSAPYGGAPYSSPPFGSAPYPYP